jgi:molybdate transport system substrate-binding protein
MASARLSGELMAVGVAPHSACRNGGAFFSGIGRYDTVRALARAFGAVGSPALAALACRGKPMARVHTFMAKTITLIAIGVAIALSGAGTAVAGNVEVFHADSLAGPLGEIKKAFEAKNRGITISLTPGVSRQLADRILNGETCDVFAPSAQAVAEEMLSKKIAGSNQDAASWYVVFSANEMVVITAKGNPLGIRQVADLAKPGVKFIRITREKDLGDGRTIEFLKRAASFEGKPELAQKIIDAAVVDPSKPAGVPDVVRAVREGKVDAGVVYYSAAIAAPNDIDIVRFPASVNMSEAIRNAATVPGTAKNPKEAIDFIRFVLSAEGQRILQGNRPAAGGAHHSQRQRSGGNNELMGQSPAAAGIGRARPRRSFFRRLAVRKASSIACSALSLGSQKVW